MGGKTQLDALMESPEVISRQTLETKGVLCFLAKWPLVYSECTAPSMQAFIEVRLFKSSQLKEGEIKMVEQLMPDHKMIQKIAEGGKDFLLQCDSVEL